VHLLFMQSGPAKWTVRDAGSKNGSWLDGVQLAPGEPKPLVDGMRIQTAQVVLTYYEPPGLFARLQQSGAPATAGPRIQPPGTGTGT
jgi:pSer/pThr/pTyr-binding forkhead associated (FHA) protein